MGRDSATFQDKGTEVPSLFREKGTTGQAQNHAKGRDEPGQAGTACQNLGLVEGRDNHQFSLKIRDGPGTGPDNN